MKLRAAVVRQRNGPFELEDLWIEEPRSDEVLVDLKAVGICRTDLHIRGQEYPVPAFPVVAGHEGAGVIAQVGSDVENLAVGDRVVISYPSCGECRQCHSHNPAYCSHGFALSFGGQRLDGSSALTDRDGSRVNGHVFQQSSFASACIAPARSVVRVNTDISDAWLAPLGCGLQTGTGVILDALRVPAGATVAVVGTGAVGLAAVAAARSVGAARVIAVDTNPRRLKMAEEFGADLGLQPGDRPMQQQILDVEPAGVDFLIDTTAHPQLLADLLGAVAMTGTSALVGAAPAGTTSPIDMNLLLNGRSLRGSIQGDSVPEVAVPRLISMIETSQLPVHLMVREYPLEQINQAVVDMEAGMVVKPVLITDN